MFTELVVPLTGALVEVVDAITGVGLLVIEVVLLVTVASLGVGLATAAEKITKGAGEADVAAAVVVVYIPVELAAFSKGCENVIDNFSSQWISGARPLARKQLGVFRIVVTRPSLRSNYNNKKPNFF